MPGSDYIMMPGARLEVGPNGQLEETLGACCASCDKQSLGALSFSAWGYTVPTPVVAGVAAVGIYMLFFRKKRNRR